MTQGWYISERHGLGITNVESVCALPITPEMLVQIEALAEKEGITVDQWLNLYFESEKQCSRP